MKINIYFTFLLIGLIYSLPIDETVLEPTDEESELQYNKDLFEGDIMFEENELILDIDARNANIKARRWENGVIPFVIDSASRYTSTEVNTILSAMKKMETDTNGCLRFVPRTTERYYISIRHTTGGCYSYVGKQNTAGQVVSLQKNGCVYPGTVTHELLHVAGFEHEQSRPDRDQYVTINYGNIQTGAEAQFKSYPSTIVSTLNQPYDFYSVMHYRYNAFTKNGSPTITPKLKNVDQLKMGVRNSMSPTDIIKVKIFYGCPL